MIKFDVAFFVTHILLEYICAYPKLISMNKKIRTPIRNLEQGPNILFCYKYLSSVKKNVPIMVSERESGCAEKKTIYGCKTI